MKSDIVNPIPPRQPTPRICLQATPSGSAASPRRTASQDETVMPKGFPMTRARNTPSVAGWDSASRGLPWKTTAELKKANTGMMRYMTHG